MNILDITILVILAVGIWQGWHNGLIKSLCSFVGFTLGLFIAATFYNIVGHELAPHLDESAQTVSVIAFILIWLIFPIAMGVVGDILTKCISILFLGGINKALGAVFSFVKYFLCTALVMYVLVLIGIVSQETTSNSFFGSMLTTFVDSFMDSFREVSQI